MGDTIRYKKLAAIAGVLLILCSVTALAAQKETIAQMSIASKNVTSSASVSQSQGIYANTIVSAGSIWKRLPDLRVTQVVPGTPSFESGGSVANVPLAVTIKNFGAATKEKFKISVDVQVDGESRYLRPFIVPGQSDIWFPWQNGLGSGAEATFKGNLVIGVPSGDSLTGKGAHIIAMVDSIAGDEFVPDWGRVMESNEENNEMEVRTQLT